MEAFSSPLAAGIHGVPSSLPISPILIDVNAAQKTIAWNRVRLTVPIHWEIGRIDSRQLMFQDDSKPSLELKWQPIKGKFSHRAHLKRLAARHKTGLRQSIQAWQLPPAWEKALKDFTVSGFSWAGESGGGRGAILFCPLCRNATLIQFFDAGLNRRSAQPSSILATFRDHRSDGRSDWRVFDIRACLPDTFSLQAHRFQPGNYALSFSDGRRSVHLWRWAPASAFLNSQTLMQFAASLTHDPPQTFSPISINGYPAVEAVRTPSAGRKRWFLPNRSNHLFRIRRFWHLQDKNRILGMNIESMDTVESPLADTICESYDSL